MAGPPNPGVLQKLAACDQALEANPSSAPLHRRRGGLLTRLRRLPEAEAALRTSISLQADSAESWTALSRVLGGQGRTPAATQALEQALSLGERPRDLVLDLARLLLADRRYQEAERELARLEAEDAGPDLAPLLQAARDGLAADAGNGVSPALRSGLRQALDHLLEGRPAEAEPLLTDVLRRRPTWAEAWLALRGARQALGDAAGAAAVLEQWRAADPAQAAAIRMAAARPLSPRGLLVDPREPLPIRPRSETLRRVESREALARDDDVFLLLEPGGAPVRREPVISVEPDGSDAFVVETVTSESSVTALSDAALVGRGLVVSRRNEVVQETLLTMVNQDRALGKYGAARRDGRLWLDPGSFADGDLDVRFVEEPAFLMAGPTDSSFGDWMWRFHPRLSLARDAGLDVKLVVARQAPSRFLELLELSGFDRSRLVFHDTRGVTVFRRLYVPSWPTPDRLRPMTDWFSAYAPLAQRGSELADIGPDAGPDRPLLYLSRTKVSGRDLVNEAEIEALFASRGFQIVHPQELSWTEALRLFARPAVVAGPYGSAVRNLVFTHQKPLGLFLMPPFPEEFLHGSSLWLAEAGVRHAWVHGGDVEVDGDSPEVGVLRRRQREPWSVDIGKVEAALDKVLAMIPPG